MAALLTPAATSGATKGHGLRLTCPPAHAEVLSADMAAVVYQIERPAEDLYMEAACSHAYRRPYVLTWCESLDCGGPFVSDVVLAGNILAFQESGSGEDRYGIAFGPREWGIRVRNLRTGRLLHSSPSSTSPPGCRERARGRTRRQG